MKKLVLLTAVVLTTISFTFSQTKKEIEPPTHVHVNLNASVVSVPSPLNSTYANGDVIFEYLDTYSKTYKVFTVPYTGLGNYQAYLCINYWPGTVYHRVKLDITTKPISGFEPITWWTGKAIAEKVYTSYFSTSNGNVYFNCDLYETNFYELIQHGIAIDDNELSDR